MIIAVMENEKMADYIDKQKTMNVIFEIAENVINSLPSADVQPVRHGQWIPLGHHDLYKCSCCGDIWASAFYNFCPNCGARMDRKDI